MFIAYPISYFRITSNSLLPRHAVAKGFIFFPLKFYSIAYVGRYYLTEFDGIIVTKLQLYKKHYLYDGARLLIHCGCVLAIDDPEAMFS